MVITAVTTAGVLLMLHLQRREANKLIEEKEANRDSGTGGIQ